MRQRLGQAFTLVDVQDGEALEEGNRMRILLFVSGTVVLRFWCEAVGTTNDRTPLALADIATGLAPTPWQSGNVSREQGVSQAGNPRLRTIMVLVVASAPTGLGLTRCFRERTKADGGSKPTIIAIARKLLIALWKFVHGSVVIEGAVVKRA